MSEYVLYVALIIWLSGVIATDIARRRVHNTWVIAGTAMAVAALAFGRSPFGTVWNDALIGGLGAFCLLLGCYATGLMGAGDVKFAGVLGLWFGWQPLVGIAVDAGLLAGLHAVIWMTSRRRSAARDMAGIDRLRQAEPASSFAGHQIPYAGYLSIAALLWMAFRHAGTPT